MTYDEMKKMLGNGFSQKETIEVLQMLQGKRLKVFIDAYKEKPFMLLCRSRNNKAEVIIKDNRIQIQNQDKCNTMLLNVPFDEIQNLIMNIQEGYSKKCKSKIYIDCFLNWYQIVAYSMIFTYLNMIRNYETASI